MPLDAPVVVVRRECGRQPSRSQGDGPLLHPRHCMRITISWEARSATGGARSSRRGERRNPMRWTTVFLMICSATFEAAAVVVVFSSAAVEWDCGYTSVATMGRHADGVGVRWASSARRVARQRFEGSAVSIHTAVDGAPRGADNANAIPPRRRRSARMVAIPMQTTAGAGRCIRKNTAPVT